jgi:hypothetical protein
VKESGGERLPVCICHTKRGRGTISLKSTSDIPDGKYLWKAQGFDYLLKS